MGKINNPGLKGSNLTTLDLKLGGRALLCLRANGLKTLVLLEYCLSLQDMAPYL